MPRKIKRTVAKRTAKIKKDDVVTPVVKRTDSVRLKALAPKFLVLALLVVVLGLILYRNKNLFIVATVNGSPVWRTTLDNKLVSQFGQQTLDELVGETLIRQAAAKNKVVVTKADVDIKLAEIEKTLNGQISLKDALAQQGDTIESFQKRIELQLLLEKLTAGQIAVTDQEVTDYVDKNKATLSATDEAGMRDEAKTILTQQKQSTVLRQYFTDLKSKAQVSKFL